MKPSLRQPKQNLIIAIHDVAPCFEDEIRLCIAALHEAGVSCCSLLAIPHYHHQRSLKEAPAFVAWLEALVRSGSEVVLHGYHHLEAVRSSSLRHRFLTAGEGEFAVRAEDEALELIRSGQAMLESLGFSPQGFIPPAWLMSREARRALGKTSLLFCEDHLSVWHIHKKWRIFSPAIGYIQRSAIRRRLALRLNPLMLSMALRAPLVRLAIHPCDIRDGETFDQIIDLIFRHRLGERATTYRALFADSTSSPRAEGR